MPISLLFEESLTGAGEFSIYAPLETTVSGNDPGNSVTVTILLNHCTMDQTAFCQRYTPFVTLKSIAYMKASSNHHMQALTGHFNVCVCGKLPILFL